MKGLMFICLTLPCFQIQAQVSISGKITDESGRAVASANVLLSAPSSATILAFAITGEDGTYILQQKSNGGTLIKVSALGYEPQERNLILAMGPQNFILKSQVTLLPTVIVKQSPISQKGDTLSYYVRSFARTKDEMIGDILANLPGVSIDNAGRITYNGKAISHYYIDGIDMLGEKYNIANKNIPADIVDRVELLQHHQDIKMLTGVQASDEVALNLHLNKKSKNKFLGGGSAAAGVAPALYDGSVRAMNFRNNMQFIAAGKTNNVGRSLATEIQGQAMVYRRGDELIKLDATQAINNFWWGTPSILASRYLFNQSNLVNFNGIKKTKTGIEISAGVSFLNDLNSYRNGATNTYFFVDQPDIVFVEQTDATDNKNSFEAQAGILMNTKSKYLKNKFSAKIENLDQGGLIVNKNDIRQEMTTPTTLLTNEFKTLLPYKNQFLSFTNTTLFSKSPQQLFLYPGQFAVAVNNGDKYDKLIQNVTLRNLLSDNTIGFTRKIGKYMHEARLGLRYTDQSLESNLFKVVQGNTFNLADTFNNKIQRKSAKIYAENLVNIEKGKSSLTLRLPLSVERVFLVNNVTFKTKQNNFVLFTPALNYLFKWSAAFELGADFERLNTLGFFLQQPTGYIVKSYRTIQRGDDVLPISNVTSITARAEYKKPLQAFFAGTEFSAASKKNDFIYSQIFSNFLVTTVGLPLVNEQRSLELEMHASKYFVNQKLSLALSIYHGVFDSELLQNGNVVNGIGKNTGGKFQLNYNGYKKLSISTTVKYNYFISEVQNSGPARSSLGFGNFTHTLQLTYDLPKRYYTYSSQEIYHLQKASDDATYHFLDFGIAKKFKKNKLELECSNLTNNRRFQTVSNTQNLNRIAVYEIRPRNVLLRASFKL